MLKSIVSRLNEQVIGLKHAISKLNTCNSTRSTGPDIYQSGPLLSKPERSTEHPPDQFGIHLKSPVFQPATEQTTFQEENQAQTPNPLKESDKNARTWTSPEEEPDYEAEQHHSPNGQVLFHVNFPPISKNKQKLSSPRDNSIPTLKKGWAIAASSLPVPGNPNFFIWRYLVNSQISKTQQMQSSFCFQFSILDYAHRYSVMYTDSYLLTTSEVWLTLHRTEK